MLWTAVGAESCSHAPASSSDRAWQNRHWASRPSASEVRRSERRPNTSSERAVAVATSGSGREIPLVPLDAGDFRGRIPSSAACLVNSSSAPGPTGRAGYGRSRCHRRVVAVLTIAVGGPISLATLAISAAVGPSRLGASFRPATADRGPPGGGWLKGVQVTSRLWSRGG